jgi:ligand-binding sensor domain-containing protein/serine phosphatase RsbU (regulator of sigma subunit)
MKKLILFLIFSTIFLTEISSQSSQIKFTRINIDDGLSLSSVYSGLQDSKGFLWFGTEDGLNRFDGFKFTIFRPQTSDTNTLSHKWIDAIYEDKFNYLWIITKQGINKYNPQTETFRRYLTNNRSSNSNTLTCYYEDLDSIIWVGSQKGAFRYNREKDIFEKIGDDVLSGKFINCFIQITENKLLIGTTDGLFEYSESSKELVELEIPVNSKLVNCFYRDLNKNIWIGTQGYLLKYQQNQYSNTFEIKNFPLIETIFQDKKLRYWIGTSDGFYKFEEAKLQFEKIIDAPEVSGSLSINNKKPIFEDSDGNIWFGTYGRGVYKLSNNSSILSNYISDATNNNSLSENAVNLIFQDSSGCLWFGTFGAGLNKYDPFGAKFPLIKHNPYDDNSLSNNFIWSMYEDSDGELWIGTNSNGVDRYNPLTGIYTHYPNNPNNSNSISNNCVREIYQDNEGILWFGTNGGGLNKFDKKTNTFTVYKNVTEDSTSISNNSVRVIFQDSKDIFWIGTVEGFNRFDAEKETFKPYLHDVDNPNSISSNFIYSVIYENSDGKIWIGTYASGLSIFNPETEEFENYLHSENDTASIASDIIYSIEKDENNFFWISTNDGLDKFDYENGIFYHYGIEQGLPSNTIYGMLPDKNGNLWMSTNFGVSKFNIKSNSFKNFDVSDGLQSNEFNGGAFHLGKSGKIYFAGVYGLNAFFPDSLKYNTNTPSVVLTDFMIFSSKVDVLNSDFLSENNIGNDIVLISDRYFMRKSIAYTDTIILSYREKVFSFEFAALHFSNPLKNKYKYRLVNFEENWNEASNRNFVTYTNLDAGTYYFEVTAANSDGIWSDKITQLTIIITPPYWETWLFRISLILLVFGIVYFIYRSRINRIKNQKERLEVIVKERTYEIVQKNVLLEQQKEEIQTQANNLLTANTEITVQKELMEKAHKNITDSILYAKRIQSAVLPDPKFISMLLPEHFIVFKPRDIVSGDFYFIKQIKNFTLIAVADCTGHGVPGAFMSMLGITLLNEIISNKEISTSSQVLNELRIQIKKSLQQTGQLGEQQDGMDIAFCTINIETWEMSFAGAHNPLYLIRNYESGAFSEELIMNEPNSIFNKNNSKLITIEADRQPVGIFLKEKPFSEQKFQLQKDDVFYLFSDGFQSQFGSEKNETFKAKRFKDILMEICGLSMSEQKLILENTFENWKGKIEQTDDVLIIGVKI